MSDLPRPAPAIVTLPSSGLRLALLPGDPLSQAMADGAFEVAELMFATRMCRTGDVVVDVGAHVGLYTVHMAAAVGPGGHTYAFESSPDAAACLLASIAANRLSQVSVVAVAAGSGPGPASQCLDAGVDRRPVSFIKLDVDGAEWVVLKGAAAILGRDRPALLCEIDYPGLRRVSKVSPEDLFGWLASEGYEGYAINPDGSPGAALPHPPTARTSSVGFFPAERRPSR